MPSREARQTTIPTVLEGSSNVPSAAMITRLVSLKYVSADEMKQLISPLVSGDGLLNAYTGTNSLIIIDSEDNIARVIKLIDELDVPFSNRDMTIIQIQHAEAADIADKLKEILGDKDKGSEGRASLGEASIPNPGMRTNINGMPVQFPPECPTNPRVVRPRLPVLLLPLVVLNQR